MRTLTLLFLFALTLAAQNTRTVVLTWEDTTNPVGTTYAIYRAQGQCTGSNTFTQIATGITLKTHTDVGVAVGNYCYVATALYGGMESEYSDPAWAAVRPFKPQRVAVEVK